MDNRSGAPERGRCNCTALRKASRRLTQAYDAHLAPTGLKSTQFSILGEIGRSQGQSPSLRELAEALAMDASTLGQNLRPLERDEIVSIEADAEDRRRRCVKLTARGLSLLAAGRPLWAKAQAQFEAGFGEREAAELRALLAKISSGVHGPEAALPDA